MYCGVGGCGWWEIQCAAGGLVMDDGSQGSGFLRDRNLGLLERKVSGGGEGASRRAGEQARVYKSRLIEDRRTTGDGERRGAERVGSGVEGGRERVNTQ